MCPTAQRLRCQAPVGTSAGRSLDGDDQAFFLNSEKWIRPRRTTSESHLIEDHLSSLLRTPSCALSRISPHSDKQQSRRVPASRGFDEPWQQTMKLSGSASRLDPLRTVLGQLFRPPEFPFCSCCVPFVELGERLGVVTRPARDNPAWCRHSAANSQLSDTPSRPFSHP